MHNHLAVSAVHPWGQRQCDRMRYPACLCARYRTSLRARRRLRAAQTFSTSPGAPSLLNYSSIPPHWNAETSSVSFKREATHGPNTPAHVPPHPNPKTFQSRSHLPTLQFQKHGPGAIKISPEETYLPSGRQQCSGHCVEGGAGGRSDMRFRL